MVRSGVGQLLIGRYLMTSFRNRRFDAQIGRFRQHDDVHPVHRVRSHNFRGSNNERPVKNNKNRREKGAAIQAVKTPIIDVITFILPVSESTLMIRRLSEKEMRKRTREPSSTRGKVERGCETLFFKVSLVRPDTDQTMNQMDFFTSGFSQQVSPLSLIIRLRNLPGT